MSKLQAILVLLSLELSMPQALSQNLKSNIPYVQSGHQRQVLDVYWPVQMQGLPVIFWIHGGGWVTGDKTDIQIKPQVFCNRGFVFVATNYRLLPEVEMQELVRDVAEAIGWVHRKIAEYGGDPNRIIVMGHSAGAQLAALLSIDHRYLTAVGVPISALRGCVPVDGDTFDLAPIIATAEFRAIVYGQPLPNFGHRQKFGNDPKKHIEFSAVTHISKGKLIPPHLILHVAGHPDTTAQAQRLGQALRAADVPARIFAAQESTHRKLNENLGVQDDPATIELFKFLDTLIK